MSGRTTDPERDGGLPDPPFGEDLLADYHGGLLEPAVRTHIEINLVHDPRAREILTALDRIRGELAELNPPSDPTPAYLRLRLEETLTTIADEIADRPAR